MHVEGETMRRRDFIGGLGLAAVVPAATYAQQGPAPVIGFLSGRSAKESAALLAAFQRGLAENGFEVGRNVALELRWAEGRYDSLPQLAAELVKRGVVAIAAVGG